MRMDAEPALGCAFNIDDPFRTAALMSVAGMSKVEKVPLWKFLPVFCFLCKNKTSLLTPKKKNKLEASPPLSLILRANVLALPRLALVAWTSSRFH